MHNLYCKVLYSVYYTALNSVQCTTLDSVQYSSTVYNVHYTVLDSVHCTALDSVHCSTIYSVHCTALNPGLSVPIQPQDQECQSFEGRIWLPLLSLITLQLLWNYPPLPAPHTPAHPPAPFHLFFLIPPPPPPRPRPWPRPRPPPPSSLHPDLPKIGKIVKSA